MIEYQNRHHNLGKIVNQSAENFNLSYEKDIMGLHGISTKGRKVQIPILEKEIVDFSRCSYLGLDNHPTLINGAIEAIKKYNSLHWSCARTRLNFSITEELESKLSVLFNCKAITFSSVFLCNMAIVPLLACGAFKDNVIPDIVVFDKNCHVSLSYHKSVVAQYTKVITIDHNDMDELETLCKTYNKVVFIGDGVYSMGGNCPIQYLKYLQDKYDLFIYLDDAHGISIIGNVGEGYVKTHFYELGENTIITTSLGKGFGASGGFTMLGSIKYENIIRRYAQPYAFSVGGNIAAIGAALGSIEIHKTVELKHRVEKLRKNIALFDNLLPTSYQNPVLPIRIVPMCNEYFAINLAENLLKVNGFYTSAVFFPTVKKPALRISISSDHTENDIIGLVNNIKSNIRGYEFDVYESETYVYEQQPKKFEIL